jgi:hypothetical protein
LNAHKTNPFGTNFNNFNQMPLSKKQPAQAFKTYGSQEYGIPKKKICIPMEARDRFVFCTSGSPHTLAKLFELFKISIKDDNSQWRL